MSTDFNISQGARGKNAFVGAAEVGLNGAKLKTPTRSRNHD